MLSLRLFRVGLVFVRLLLEIWTVVLYLLCLLYQLTDIVEACRCIFTIRTQRMVCNSVSRLLSLYPITGSRNEGY